MPGSIQRKSCCHALLSHLAVLQHSTPKDPMTTAEDGCEVTRRLAGLHAGASHPIAETLCTPFRDVRRGQPSTLRGCAVELARVAVCSGRTGRFVAGAPRWLNAGRAADQCTTPERSPPLCLVPVRRAIRTARWCARPNACSTPQCAPCSCRFAGVACARRALPDPPATLVPPGAHAPPLSSNGRVCRRAPVGSACHHVNSHPAPLVRHAQQQAALPVGDNHQRHRTPQQRGARRLRPSPVARVVCVK